jgi:hypothetical protein
LIISNLTIVLNKNDKADIDIPYDYISFHATNKEEGYVMLQLNIPEKDVNKFEEVMKLNPYDRIFIYTKDKAESNF